MGGKLTSHNYYVLIKGCCCCAAAVVLLLGACRSMGCQVAAASYVSTSRTCLAVTPSHAAAAPATAWQLLCEGETGQHCPVR
jgi:hypothetical protein